MCNGYMQHHSHMGVDPTLVGSNPMYEDVTCRCYKKIFFCFSKCKHETAYL